MGLFDRLRGGDAPRVAFFGIDGVPHSLIREHPDVFPNLHEIADEGAAGAIDSIVPPESSACWPSLTTGVNPGETGVYGFTDRETGSYDTYVPMGADVQADRVWDRVEDAGRSASVLNVPVTFPPQRDVQRMVSGFLSPGVDRAAYPDELREYLEGLDWTMDVDAQLGHREDRSAFVENAHDVLDSRYEAFSHYIAEDDWDLLFGVFMTTDRVNHFLFRDYERDGPFKEEFLSFYRRVDEYLGQLRDELPDDVTMVVASDHGFTSLEYEVHCNVWLEEQGWLSFADDEHEDLDDIGPDTRAYSFIPGRFYLNLEGREPRGTVARDDYQSVRAELKADIEALEGPDGRPVVERVVEKEAAFDGPHDEIAPDLVAIPNHGFDLKSGFAFEADEAIFDADGPRNGMHSFSNATLHVDDPDVRVDGDVNLFDITPTLLELLDVEFRSAAFDGRSLA